MGILAQAVILRSVSSAGVSNFACTQINVRRVECDFTVFSSGDISLQAIDNAGNERFRAINGYTIVADTSVPSITYIAPTKTSNQVIRDTRIVVQDNVGISANAVILWPGGTTSDVEQFNCSQTSVIQVDCQLTIKSSGNILIRATDQAGNERFRSENGYIINLIDSSHLSPMMMLLLEE